MQFRKLDKKNTREHQRVDRKRSEGYLFNFLLYKY